MSRSISSVSFSSSCSAPFSSCAGATVRPGAVFDKESASEGGGGTASHAGSPGPPIRGVAIRAGPAVAARAPATSLARKLPPTRRNGPGQGAASRLGTPPPVHARTFARLPLKSF